jgi:hypothetical protein
MNSQNAVTSHQKLEKRQRGWADFGADGIVFRSAAFEAGFSFIIVLLTKSS